MSRIIRHLIDQALLGEEDSLNLLLFGRDVDMAKKLASDSKHTFYCINQEYIDLIFQSDKPYSVVGCSQEDIFSGLSYVFDGIVSCDPYDNIKVTSEISARFHIPLILLHNEIPNIRREALFQASKEMERFINVSHDLGITKSCFINNAVLANTKTTDTNLDGLLNELLYNQ